MREATELLGGGEADSEAGGRAVDGIAHRMQSRRFRCEVVRDGTVVRITLEGELDIATAPEVEAALRDVADGPSSEPCVLDLRGLTFMDSSGLRTILSANGAARRDDRRLRLVAGPPAVQRVFEICGVADGLRFVDP